MNAPTIINNSIYSNKYINPDIQLSQREIARKKGFQRFKQKLENARPMNLTGDQGLITLQKDHRETLKKMQYPFTAIGQLLVTFSKNSKGENIIVWGTGFLIRDNIVLTCAHNVYNRLSNNMAIEVQFIPGFHGKVQQKNVSKRYIAAIAYVPGQYENDKNIEYKNYDFAILILCTSSLADKFGYLGVSYDEIKINQEELTIYGYPKDLNDKNQLKQMYQFGCSGKVVKCDQNRIYHQIDTSAGQSGSPIFRKTSKGYYQVVGIHSSQGIPQDLGFFCNIGVKITQKMLIKINKWIYLDEQNSQQRSNFLKQIILKNQAENIKDKRGIPHKNLEQIREAINISFIFDQIYDQEYIKKKAYSFFNERQYRKSSICFDKLKDIIGQKLQKNYNKYISLQIDISISQIGIHNHKKARKILQKVLKAIQKVQEQIEIRSLKNKKQINLNFLSSVISTNQIQTFFLQKCQKQKLQNEKKIKQIQKQKCSIYEKLACISYYQYNFEASFKYVSKSLELKQKVYNIDQNIQIFMKNLSLLLNAYLKLDDFQDFLSLILSKIEKYEQYLLNKEISQGQNSWNFVKLLHAKGLLLMKKQIIRPEYNLTFLSSFQKAVQIYENLIASKNISQKQIFHDLHSIAQMYNFCFENEKALKIYQKIYNQQINTNGQSVQIQYIVHNLGKLYRLKYDNQKVKILTKKNYKNQSQIKSVQLKIKKYKQKAEMYLLKSFKLSVQYYGIQSKATADSFSQLGHFYHSIGRILQGNLFLQSSISLKQKYYQNQGVWLGDLRLIGKSVNKINDIDKKIFQKIKFHQYLKADCVCINTLNLVWIQKIKLKQFKKAQFFHEQIVNGKKSVYRNKDRLKIYIHQFLMISNYYFQTHEHKKALKYLKIYKNLIDKAKKKGFLNLYYVIIKQFQSKLKILRFQVDQDQDFQLQEVN